jgi:hypothetical protein
MRIFERLEQQEKIEKKKKKKKTEFRSIYYNLYNKKIMMFV